MVEKVFELTYDGIRKLQDELETRKTTIAAEIAERLKEPGPWATFPKIPNTTTPRKLRPKMKCGSWRSNRSSRMRA
jgi:hypothetical protein